MSFVLRFSRRAAMEREKVSADRRGCGPGEWTPLSCPEAPRAVRQAAGVPLCRGHSPPHPGCSRRGPLPVGRRGRPICGVAG